MISVCVGVVGEMAIFIDLRAHMPVMLKVCSYMLAPNARLSLIVAQSSSSNVFPRRPVFKGSVSADGVYVQPHVMIVSRSTYHTHMPDVLLKVVCSLNLNLKVSSLMAPWSHRLIGALECSRFEEHSWGQSKGDQLHLVELERWVHLFC